MERIDYINELQDDLFQEYAKGVLFQKDIEIVYDEIDYKLRQADLLGKTVEATEKQFPELFIIIQRISGILGINPPPVFVYDSYYYGAASTGISKCWIEISARTLQDLPKEDIEFILGRELYMIADGIVKEKTMMEERFNAIATIAPKEIEQVSRLKFYHWYRTANFGADNFGYLMCGSLKYAAHSILTIVLNSRMLAERVNMEEYLSQASKINLLDDTIYNYTKADEAVPYGPHRIKNLMEYSMSERGMMAIRECESMRKEWE